MPEPAEGLPQASTPQSQDPKAEGASPEDKLMDPQDLVYKGGYRGNPREILDNPAVAPQTLDVDDLRDDLMPSE